MRRETWASLLLGVLVWISFYRVLSCDFIRYDDDVFITGNPHLKNGLTPESVLWAFSAEFLFDSAHANLWVPLTLISHAIDVTLYGLNPAGHHLTSLLLHTVNTILLFYLLYRSTSAFWPSVLAAVLFAVHPQRVESVAWITERKDVLSATFGFLSIGCYGLYVRRAGWVWYLFSIGAFFLSLLSKPMLVTLPVLLLALDYWPLRRFGVPAGASSASSNRWSALCFEKIPFLLLSLIIGVINAYGQSYQHQTSPWILHILRMLGLDVVPGHSESGTSLGYGVLAILAYLRFWIWPHPLSLVYPPPTPAPGPVILAAVLTAVLTVWVLSQRSRRPYLAVGWIWFVIILLPVIGIELLALADRYTYVSHIGLNVMLAWGLSDLVRSFPRLGRPIASAATGVGMGLCALVWIQTGYWKDSFTLFQRSIDVTENNWKLQNGLGSEWFLRGDRPAALAHYRESVRINPQYAQAHFNLGSTLVLEGDTPAGLKHLFRSIELDPFGRAAHDRLSVILMAEGRVDLAVYHHNEAERIRALTELDY